MEYLIFCQFTPRTAQEWHRSCREQFFYPPEQSSPKRRLAAGVPRHFRPRQNNMDTAARGLSSARFRFSRNQTNWFQPVSVFQIAAKRTATFQNLRARRPPPRSNPPATNRCREKRRARPTHFLKNQKLSKSISA